MERRSSCLRGAPAGTLGCSPLGSTQVPAQLKTQPYGSRLFFGKKGEVSPSKTQGSKVTEERPAVAWAQSPGAHPRAARCHQLSVQDSLHLSLPSASTSMEDCFRPPKTQGQSCSACVAVSCCGQRQTARLSCSHSKQAAETYRLLNFRLMANRATRPQKAAGVQHK